MLAVAADDTSVDDHVAKKELRDEPRACVRACVRALRRQDRVPGTHRKVSIIKVVGHRSSRPCYSRITLYAVTFGVNSFGKKKSG
jgi:pyridoxine/pyridoxamine 5'-phosphate oxidase